MAVTEETIKQQCQLRLNNGTDSDGNVKTVGLSLGTLSATGWNADKAVNIVQALSPCLTKATYEVYHIETTTMDI